MDLAERPCGFDPRPGTFRISRVQVRRDRLHDGQTLPNSGDEPVGADGFVKHAIIAELRPKVFHQPCHDDDRNVARRSGGWRSIIRSAVMPSFACSTRKPAQNNTSANMRLRSGSSSTIRMVFSDGGRGDVAGDNIYKLAKLSIEDKLRLHKNCGSTIRCSARSRPRHRRGLPFSRALY